jgi:hypothetical protein
MKKILLILAVILGLISFISAGSFVIENSTGNVFTVSNQGAVNASGTIAESGVLLSDTYCKLSGCTYTGNIIGNNITAQGGYYFVGSGLYLTALNGSLITSGSIYTIPLNASQIDTGTIAFARLPTLTNTHTHDYHNITGMPTCSAGTHLYFDGTTLSCTADATGADLTNYALKNQTNTFTGDQVFSNSINVTGNVTMKTNVTGIRWDTGTFIYKDNSGNIKVRLE